MATPSGRRPGRRGGYAVGRVPAGPARSYVSDEVTRLIIDLPDRVAFASVTYLTVGGLRDWLLEVAVSDDAAAVLALVAPGRTPEMVAGASKLMRNNNLVSVAQAVRVRAGLRRGPGVDPLPVNSVVGFIGPGVPVQRQADHPSRAGGPVLRQAARAADGPRRLLDQDRLTESHTPQLIAELVDIEGQVHGVPRGRVRGRQLREPLGWRRRSRPWQTDPRRREPPDRVPRVGFYDRSLRATGDHVACRVAHASRRSRARRRPVSRSCPPPLPSAGP